MLAITRNLTDLAVWWYRAERKQLRSAILSYHFYFAHLTTIAQVDDIGHRLSKGKVLYFII
jgi:hypothetical protein